jgi:hypothetical protein
MKTNQIATTPTATEIPDELNPAYMLQMIRAELLLKIASGELNAVELAKQELAARGLDVRTGKWVGFPAAAASAKLHATRNGKGQTVWISIPE